MLRNYITAGLFLLTATAALAQGGTKSPYSQFGLGMIADQSTGFNRGMDGLSIGFHENKQVNYLNPASYSELDSLTFLFDAGMSGQFTHFKENGLTKNAKGANFEYVVAGFRLMRHLGLGFGLMPYSNIGYNYATSEQLNDANRTTSYNTYEGSGGVHQLFLGLGWSPFKRFSIGFNFNYLYGSLDRSVANSFSATSVNTLMKIYSADVKSYKLDFGAQYTFPLTKKGELTVGATYTPGHKIGGKPTLQLISSNTSTADTLTFPGGGSPELKLEIPTVIGVGLMYNHGNMLKVGVDYTIQKWKDVEEPESSTTPTGTTYTYGHNQFKDRHKVVIGADYCPGATSRRFLNRVHYKAGFGYATPYYYINGQDGPKEISASLGFGIPIINSWNNRSILNISGQWVHQSATNFITDNSFRINIGFTFNERWFAKWKVE